MLVVMTNETLKIKAQPKYSWGLWFIYMYLPEERKTSLNLIIPGGGKRENRTPNPRFAPTFTIFNWFVSKKILAQIRAVISRKNAKIACEKKWCHWDLGRGYTITLDRNIQHRVVSAAVIACLITTNIAWFYIRLESKNKRSIIRRYSTFWRWINTNFASNLSTISQVSKIVCFLPIMMQIAYRLQLIRLKSNLWYRHNLSYTADSR